MHNDSEHIFTMLWLGINLSLSTSFHLLDMYFFPILVTWFRYPLSYMLRWQLQIMEGKKIYIYQYTCNYCESKFTSTTSLANHQKLHFGNSPEIPKSQQQAADTACFSRIPKNIETTLFGAVLCVHLFFTLLYIYCQLFLQNIKLLQKYRRHHRYWDRKRVVHQVKYMTFSRRCRMFF